MLSDCKWAAAAVLAAALLTGCTLTPNRAPVEDRSAVARVAVAPLPPAVPAASAAVPGEPVKPVPIAEAGVKPGYYAVKPGDTLIRIGLENGQNWKDLMRWNALENPNVIEVGQVLRVWPPGVDPSVAATRPIAAPRVETRPLDTKAGVSTAGPAVVAPANGAASTPPAPAPVAAPAPTSAQTPAPAREGDEDIHWDWPASGAVIAPFDEGKAKGLAIGGRIGDPVFAAADGRVVYAGSGLRGYGNLIILKHNNTYLTAYAHNRTLLVKEDQNVRRGQKIAEMGSTDSDGVKLHFEIRKQGKPIDPAKLLPPR